MFLGRKEARLDGFDEDERVSECEEGRDGGGKRLLGENMLCVHIVPGVWEVRTERDCMQMTEPLSESVSESF